MRMTPPWPYPRLSCAPWSRRRLQPLSLASNTPDTHVASLAEFAVKIAQAVELAAGRSLDDERRDALTAAMDEAEGEWKKDERNAAGDLPPGAKTKNGRPMVRHR